MSNSWFSFKKFTVHQQASAMKVTTDACLFGALQRPFPKGGNGKTALDIGTGTGLLSLILAQLNPYLAITAVEIDQAAATEAVKNISGSPFANQISVIETDIALFEPASSFDLIICNPPFYENQLNSRDNRRNTAHHSTDLILTNLFTYFQNWLHPNGTASILLPFYREKETKELAIKAGLFCNEQIRVRQTPNHNYFRSIQFLSKTKGLEKTIELVIKTDANTYSDEFKALLGPFYLNM